jgi:ubiquinone/menaquinone biosynthesis C-methylase UbiE
MSVTTRRLLPLVSAALFLAAAALAWAQNNAADTAKLIDVLGLTQGSVVAEIGAGSGDLTIGVARHVGPSGRVFTSELGESRIRGLRQAVEKSGLGQIQVVDGRDTEANLADGCCDAIFMRNVYHHFADPPAMNASFLRALKPGGRIAIIDFSPRTGAATAAPGKRGEDAHHGISAQVTASELKQAGFDIVSTAETKDRWFIVVAAKPAQ